MKYSPQRLITEVTHLTKTRHMGHQSLSHNLSNLCRNLQTHPVVSGTPVMKARSRGGYYTCIAYLDKQTSRRLNFRCNHYNR